MEEKDEKGQSNATPKLARWYFGGIAAAGAACITHPLDLIKVHLQTHRHEDLGIFRAIRNVIRNGGFLAFYAGISASLFRQLLYTTTRFAIYEVGKQSFKPNASASKLDISCMAGFFGGVVGTPPDVVTVRMQNDVKLPPNRRRNYKNVFNGLYRVYTEEGFTSLFSGVLVGSTRAGLITAGQLVSYDFAKDMLLDSNYLTDNLVTHFISSVISGVVALFLSQPVDVIKTRVMNAPLEHKPRLLTVVRHTAKEGPKAFFKGLIPSAIRILPFNIFLFVFYEQLRLTCGSYPVKKGE